jgi:hypothetical protein
MPGRDVGTQVDLSSGDSVSETHQIERGPPQKTDGAGLRDDPKGPLFRTIGRGTAKLTRTVLPQANAYAMIRRRARINFLRVLVAAAHAGTGRADSGCGRIRPRETVQRVLCRGTSTRGVGSISSTPTPPNKNSPRGGDADQIRMIKYRFFTRIRGVKL